MSAKTGLDLELLQLAPLAPAGYFVGLHIRFTSPLMTLTTYPKAWIDHYTAQAYALRDPIVAWGFSTTGATRWSDIEIPDTFKILTQGAEYGLRHGVSVSVGTMDSRTIGSVARADRSYTDDEMVEIEALIQRLHRLAEPPDSLTKAQKEALRLIGEGLRHSEAAQRLGISESALKLRLTTARNKLLARTTAEALQRARQFNLL